MGDKAKLTDADLFQALQARYPIGEWALLPQVANATGGGVRGWADALAMNLWPSRGLALHGFEIKVSRSDWLRELKRPHKADTFVEKCDYWWLVVSDKAIVQGGELPDGWGLLAMHGSSLRCVTDARKQERDDQFHRSFLAAVLRQAATVVTPKAALDKAEKDGYERGRGEQEQHWTWTKERYEKLQGQVAAFQRASGLSINEYTGGSELGNAVHRVLHGAEHTARRNLENMKRTAEQIAQNATEALAAIEAAQEISA